MRTQRKFEATSRQIAELALYISVPEMLWLIPEYLPSQRTIYRRLAMHGIVKPDQSRRDFETSLIQCASVDMTDAEVKVAVEEEIQERLNCLVSQIEQEANAYQSRRV